MVSQTVWDLCNGKDTVTSVLANDPQKAPHEAVSGLYNGDFAGFKEHSKFKRVQASEEDLQKAFECGNWGLSKPSRLFLQIYHDVLHTLEIEPLASMTSPPLLGTNGVVPLTIVSTLPDICRHMSNVIARAEKDVFLATNYWMHSEPSSIISQGLKELSRRAGERGHKVVVKIMYDRGNPKQVFDNHQYVSEKMWTASAIQLPSVEEAPNLDMQVVNYHRPLLGTFHSKFMVVDRKFAIISSNNIQDNDNLEMMSHLEGPIVDSLYDTCLISWHNALKPPLPTHATPAAGTPPPSFQTQAHDRIFAQGTALKNLIERIQRNLSQQASEPKTNGLTSNQQGPEVSEEAQHQNPTNTRELPALVEHSSQDPHYDPDIASEVARSQSVMTPKEGENHVNVVTRHLNTTIQKDTTGNAPECSAEDQLIPLIPLPTHDPVPMALVCRKPWGSPNHSCVHTPQNEAFLSAVRNAQKTVFIQTPNLNAEPLLPALVDAAKRGVDVTYFVCLGYNDAGELLPFQGGNNEYIAHKLYSELTDAEKEHLHIYNYVAKDQTKPIHNSFKKRSCHIKLMIVDGHIAIQGNGNQDTQSWYHSQEVNVMVDSELVCAAWLEGIRRNQNTHLYGAVSKEDGCWHDADGKQAPNSIGNKPGHLSFIKGITGAIARVKGVGGF